MASTDYDGVLNSVKFKLVRKEGAYTKRTVRRALEQQILTQGGGGAYTSRSDQPALLQSSWADGTRWWKPLITDEDLSSYHVSNHMDVWSEPGSVFAQNVVVEASNSLHDASLVFSINGILYSIGTTTNVNASYRDVYNWVPNDDTWTQLTGVHSAVPAAAGPRAGVYDPTDGFVYIFDSTGDVVRFHPEATKSQDTTWISTSVYYGAAMFMQRGFVMAYNGDKLYTVDKATPELDLLVDDGLGPDALNGFTFSGSGIFQPSTFQLALSTPEGIYYVKNVMQGGMPTAFVFRVDRDSAGNWNLNPIASMPSGLMALNIGYHLGSVVLTMTPEWENIADDTDKEVQLFHITDGGMGSLGSVRGNRSAIDETPYKILGANGNSLYISGGKRLWMYDAIRGGLHSVFDYPTDDISPYQSMTMSGDSQGSVMLMILGNGKTITQHTLKSDGQEALDTVTAFGDDETYYTLESNYFDAGLPMELKEITKIAIQRDKGAGKDEWTVQIAADDGSFSDVLVDSGTSALTEADVSGTTGYRFRYKLIYQAKTGWLRNALRALYIGMTSGVFVTEWDLLIDGSELLNIDNEIQDEAAFRAALETAAETFTEVNFSDNFTSHYQEVDSATTVKVKVIAIEVMADAPGEPVIRVVVREP